MSELQPTISVAVVRKFVEYGAMRGLDREELIRRVSLPPTPMPKGDVQDMHMPLGPLDELFEYLMRTLDDPSVPLGLAQMFRIEDYQVLGFALMTSTNGRELIRRFVRYSTLVTPASRWECEERDGLARISWWRAGPKTLRYRCNAEYVLGAFVHQTRQLRGGDFVPVEVTFAHRRPRQTMAHERFFRCPLRFEASGYTVVFDPARLSEAPHGANPALSSFFGAHAERLLAQWHGGDSQTMVVRRAIARELTSGRPSMAAVARRLKMSERTLRRYLRKEATSFSEVVDQVRRDQAERLLHQRRLPVTEIAFVVGFSDLSAFVRAFKRWCGMTPQAFRDQREPWPEGEPRDF